MGKGMLCCPSPPLKSFLSSGLTLLAHGGLFTFSGSLQAPTSPMVWLQDCPSALWQ